MKAPFDSLTQLRRNLIHSGYRYVWIPFSFNDLIDSSLVDTEKRRSFVLKQALREDKIFCDCRFFLSHY